MTYIRGTVYDYHKFEENNIEIESTHHPITVACGECRAIWRMWRLENIVFDPSSAPIKYCPFCGATTTIIKFSNSQTNSIEMMAEVLSVKTSIIDKLYDAWDTVEDHSFIHFAESILKDANIPFNKAK